MLGNKKGECTCSLMSKSRESAISLVSATGCLQAAPRPVLPHDASCFPIAAAFAVSVGGPVFEQRSSLGRTGHEVMSVQDPACWSLRNVSGRESIWFLIVVSQKIR